MDDLTRSTSSTSNFSMSNSFSCLKIREPSVETISSLGCSQQDEQFIDVKHPQHILEKIRGFVTRNVLTDVTLMAGDKMFPCHRLLLAASSDYFAAMFTVGMAEQEMDTVHIQGVDPGALAHLIDYCYTGRLDLQEDTVENITAAACLLQLPTVIEACCSFFKKLLHPSNCIGIRLFADAQSCIQLRDFARQYTEDHFVEVTKNQEFMLLPASELEKLLSSDDLNVSSEELIYQSLVDWINFDLVNRKTEASRLLACVRLPLLRPQYIADHIENQPVLKDDPECKHLIIEAMKYHLLPERRSLLQSSRTCPRKSTVGYLYAVGGMDTNKGATSIERYDPRTDSWNQIASMNGRRLQARIIKVLTFNIEPYLSFSLGWQWLKASCSWLVVVMD
jgi:kelch-like protein 1/4/5